MAECAVKITVLGSGTSTGVPTIGCHCDVCNSSDPRDKRLRPSILVSYAGHHVLIDVTPDFRAQALRTGFERLDAILFTHAHADHIMGLDDVRPFNFRQRARIPIYASERTMAAIHGAFRYIFDGEEKNTAVPQLDSHTLNGASFDLFGVEFTPIPIVHGKATIYGFRFGNDLRFPLRQRGVSHRPQRDPRGLSRPTARAGCAVPRRAALQAAPHALHRGSFHRDGRTGGGQARLLHTYLPRSGARAH